MSVSQQVKDLEDELAVYKARIDYLEKTLDEEIDNLCEARYRITELEWRLEVAAANTAPEAAAERMHEWLRTNWDGMQLVNDVPFGCALTEWQRELLEVFK